MRIVAVSGKKGSGKDTLGKFLIEREGFVRLSFADVLKDMVSEQYDIPREWLDDSDFKEAPLYKYPVQTRDAFGEMIHSFLDKEFKEVNGTKYWTPRALAILEGSVKRSVNVSYWVNTVINQIAFGDITKDYVITDLRYKSEVEQLRSFFGKALVTVRLNRIEGTPSLDPSEVDLDNFGGFNITIKNKGSKEDLYTMYREQV